MSTVPDIPARRLCRGKRGLFAGAWIGGAEALVARLRPLGFSCTAKGRDAIGLSPPLVIDDAEHGYFEPEAGLLRPEARTSGVLYWLGLCQILMVNLVERRPDAANARLRVREMITLGLTGMGIDAALATTLADQAAARLGSRPD